MNQTEVWVDGIKLKKVELNDKCDTAKGTCKKISIEDKKVHKRVPEGQFVNIVVKVAKTGQVSPGFSYKRKKKD